MKGNYHNWSDLLMIEKKRPTVQGISPAPIPGKDPGCFQHGKSPLLAHIIEVHPRYVFNKAWQCIFISI